ncbi:hypothetical protein DFH08DRAFT_806733 [Mycena albidolilacea]|uniref:Uncharacterized protein n=1 Tax=Mycena albidolilacea TaxID=1033008 RepID=A0AAD7A6T1_9AGAR|nr:hypothetical protein DFH08DRAFT_806733 [Mycena albidolilacea]
MAMQLGAGEVKDSQFSDPELNDTPAPPPIIFQNVFPPIPGPIQNPPPINPPVSSVQQGPPSMLRDAVQEGWAKVLQVSGAYRAGTTGEAKYSQVQNHRIPSAAIAGLHSPVHAFNLYKLFPGDSSIWWLEKFKIGNGRFILCDSVKTSLELNQRLWFAPEPLPKNIAPRTAEFFLQNVVGY